MLNKRILYWAAALAAACGVPTSVLAGEADIKIPDLTGVKFDGLGGVSGIVVALLPSIGQIAPSLQFSEKSLILLS